MASRAALAAIALLLVAGILLALAWREPARMDAAETGFSAQAVARGATKYREYCAGCHGVAGLGIPGLAPALNTPDLFTRRLSDIAYPGTLRSYVEGTIATGRPVSQVDYASVMPAWSDRHGGSLRDDEIRDIASFILNWDPAANAGRSGAPTPAAHVDDASAAIQKGKAVFYGPAGCLGCHGSPGQGGISGPDMAGIARRAAGQVPGLSAEQVIRQSILAPGALMATGCPTDTCPDIMPRDYGSRLRQADLDALIRYLLTLEEGGPAHPLTGPVQEEQDIEAAKTTVVLPTVTPVPALRPRGGNPTQGQALYDQECAPCHGDRGQGGVAPGLAAVFASIDPFQYARAAVEQGVPGTTMPAWGKQAGGRLDDGQLDDIAAAIAGWADERQSPSLQRDEGSPAGGSTIWVAAGLFAALAVGGCLLIWLLQRREKKQILVDED